MARVPRLWTAETMHVPRINNHLGVEHLGHWPGYISPFQDKHGEIILKYVKVC